MLAALTVIGRWLYANVVGNEVASLLAFVAAWFWKIRPHLKAQREHREDVAAHMEHETAFRANVEHWLAGLHDRHDELAKRLDEMGAPAPTETGSHGHTETFAALTEEAP